MEQYKKYKDGGLRQKLHDAIRAQKCIRCMAVGHFRSTCTEPPKSWEADFNKGKSAFWGPKLKQARPQWTIKDLAPASAHLNQLLVTDSNRQIALDSGSEVSIGQSKHLIDLRIAKKQILVNSIGGIKFLEMEGDVLLAGKTKITVFAVEEQDLPPNTPILLGVPHIVALSVSLDFALSHPGCEIKEAMDFGLSPVISQSETPRKPEQTSLFPAPFQTLGLSQAVSFLVLSSRVSSG
jgi:hypothetical protein